MRSFVSAFILSVLPGMLCAQQFKKADPSYLFADSLVARHSLWFDVNADAALDLFIGNIYNRNNQLLISENKGLRLLPSVVSAEGGNSNSAAVADIDGDGDLDLFVNNIFGQKNYLYLNDGKGNLEKQSYINIVSQDNNAFFSSFSDVDGDGDQDLLITDTELWAELHSTKKPYIYLNNGRGEFKRDERTDLSSPKLDTRAAAWADVDNDGDQDLLIVNFGSQSYLYLNDGKGNFTKQETAISLNKSDAVDAVFGDIDNDGDEDLYIVNVRTPNVLYLNDGHGQFSLAGTSVVCSDLQISGSAALVDLNNDGTLDLFATQNNKPQNILYLNEPGVNHWVSLKLRSDAHNRYALGAKVSILCTIGGKKVWQSREIRSKAGKPQVNQYDVHFGLGDAQLIDSIRIDWPAGNRTTHTKVRADAIYLVEDAGFLQPLAATLLMTGKETPIKDVSIRLVSDSIRIGEVVTMSLFYENKSIIPLDLSVQLELNEEFQYINAFPVYSALSAGRYVWDLKQVPPATNGLITISFKLANNKSLADTEQHIRARIYPISGDEYKQDNTTEKSQRIPLKMD